METILKIVLSLWLTAIIILGIAIPTVPVPQSWFEFPLVPGLEEKAKNIFFHVPMSWVSVLAFFMSLYYGVRYLKSKDLDRKHCTQIPFHYFRG